MIRRGAKNDFITRVDLGKMYEKDLIVDANDKEYHATYSNTFILVKGDFL